MNNNWNLSIEPSGENRDEVCLELPNERRYKSWRGGVDETGVMAIAINELTWSNSIVTSYRYIHSGTQTHTLYLGY